MALKALVKRMLVGEPGLRPHPIRRGLLRGLQFHIDSATKTQRLLGLDELEITAAVRKLTGRARSALDIGANDGWYSLFFASRANIERVVAFEPSGELLRQVQQNFALNDPKLVCKLTCVHKLVGNQDNDEWCSIDRVVDQLPGPVMLKIDVDGGEVDVLRGGERLLASRAALLVVETHSKELEDGCLALLTSFNYETRIIGNGWYRSVLPERRELPHNRWLVAWPSESE